MPAANSWSAPARCTPYAPRSPITELLKLVSAVSLAGEHEPGGETEADRLLALAIDGVRPRGDPRTE
jgi:hypothetical protein